MSRSRRELLTMGGAGVAALAFPSFLPTRRGGDGIALAQGKSTAADPVVAELTRQFQRIAAGLASNPPRGNARQIASLFRMTAAWSRAHQMDAQIAAHIDSAIAVEGHHAFTARIAAVDFKAKVMAIRSSRGIALPPSTTNVDQVTVAKAIAALRAGLTPEKALRLAAQHFEKYSMQFDRQVAIANGRRPENEMVIRRIQDGGCTGDPCEEWENPPSEDDCTINPDGTATCAFTSSGPSPTAPNGLPWPTAQECADLVFALNMAWVMVGAFMILMPEMWWWFAIGEAALGYVQWYFGC